MQPKFSARPPGTENVQRATYKALKDFLKCVKAKGLTQEQMKELENLDQCFLNFAIRVEALEEKPEGAAAALAVRTALCTAAGVKVRNWKPDSMLTYTTRLPNCTSRPAPPQELCRRPKNSSPSFGFS